MERAQEGDYSGPEEPGFDLRIPPGASPEGVDGFVDVGGGGYHSYQQYAQHCLNATGGVPGITEFEAKFTAWTVQGVHGVVLYPKGPAFKVVARHFMEGDPSVTYRVGAAHFTALLLCLHPTAFLPDAPAGATPARYEIRATWEPGGIEIPVVPLKPIASTGEVFTWKHKYSTHKVSFEIRLFSSPAGRHEVYVGGRLGSLAVPSETI